MKRRRDPTFTTSEKMYIIELVEKHFAIIECKKTDAVSMRTKNEEWQKIASEFNAVSGIYPRLPAVLKNCWENLKKRAKVEQTSRNQHYMGTGGPPKKEKEDPVTTKVLDLIQARVSGYVNTYDSDGTQILGSTVTIFGETLQTENVECTSDTNICEKPEDAKESEQPSTSKDAVATLEIDWSQYTPSMLKEPINAALIRSPSPTCDVQHVLYTPTINPPERAPHTHFTAFAGTSRKRPAYKRDNDTKSIINEKLNTLVKANTHAEEEHNIKMNILHLQQQKEEEILKQEKLKTKQEDLKLKIFELQLKKLKE